MSDNWLILIPTDPEYLPDETSRRNALAIFTNFITPADEVEERISGKIVFVDPGANFVAVTCPKCGEEVTDWWSEEMNRVHNSGFFDDLHTVTPCCCFHSSLNDLCYDWPAGFARYGLEARNPHRGAFLEQPEQSALEAVLGCPLRQILQHL